MSLLCPLSSYLTLVQPLTPKLTPLTFNKIKSGKKKKKPKTKRKNKCQTPSTFSLPLTDLFPQPSVPSTQGLSYTHSSRSSNSLTTQTPSNMIGPSYLNLNSMLKQETNLDIILTIQNTSRNNMQVFPEMTQKINDKASAKWISIRVFNPIIKGEK